MLPNVQGRLRQLMCEMADVVILIMYVVGVPLMARCAPPVPVKTIPKIACESDLVVIGVALRTDAGENVDGYFEQALVQQTTRFRIEAILSQRIAGLAEEVKEIDVVHFRQKTIDEAGGPAGVINGPHCVKFLVKDANLPDWQAARYILFLRRRDDGKYDPASGHERPESSIFRMETTADVTGQ